MSYLDVEHYLGLRGSDTWSDDGNEGTIVAKTLIGRILSECESRLGEVPALYREFASRLEPGDTVLTFNYDTLLERALEAVRKPYRLFATRYSKVEGDFGTLVEDTEVAILKLHGSIDWFDKSDLEKWGVNTSSMGLAPVVDGPSFPEEPLAKFHRVRHLHEAYADHRMFMAVPKMLPPSAAKFAYAPTLTTFMRGLNNAGVLNFGMAVIGYSPPRHDQYALQILHTLIENYQTQYWEKPAFDRPKTPLVVCDLLSSAKREKAFLKRYKFVDWKRAVLHRDGFDQAAIQSIFAEQEH